MPTPEGRVKEKVKKSLGKYKGSIYYNMPVPHGYGRPMLDFVGCFHGRFFAIETKAPGEVPTTRQEGTSEDMRLGDAKVFVIDGDTTELDQWLDDLEREPPTTA